MFLLSVAVVRTMEEVRRSGAERARKKLQV